MKRKRNEQTRKNLPEKKKKVWRRLGWVEELKLYNGKMKERMEVWRRRVKGGVKKRNGGRIRRGAQWGKDESGGGKKEERLQIEGEKGVKEG